MQNLETGRLWTHEKGLVRLAMPFRQLLRSTPHNMLLSLLATAGALSYAVEVLDPPSCSADCLIDSDIKTLLRSGDPIGLTWALKDNSSATKNDWIGFYAPPFAQGDYSGHDYFMWIDVSALHTNKHIVHLTNMRADYYDIRYMRGYDCLCRAPQVKFEMGVYEPTQGHASIEHTTGVLQIQWVSGGPPSIGYLQYRTGIDEDWMTLNASVTHYTLENMCGVDKRNYYDPGYFYNVTLPLKSSSVEVRFGSAKGMSKTFVVQPGIPEGVSDGVHSIALYGDMGVQGYSLGPDKVEVGRWGWNSYWVQDHLACNPRLRLLTHIGDISYAVGNSRVWDMFGQAVQELSLKRPLVASIGNHEFDYSSGGWHPSWGNFGSDSGGECGIPTKHRYKFPNWWYSFSFGIVRYFMLSSEHDWTEGSEQWKWLNEELSKVNRSITPWVIVTSHRPMIVSAYGSSEDPVEEQLRLAMLPLFKKHKVDLFVGGHWHHYERSDPIDGTVHVIAGSAGAKDETVYPYRDLPTVPVKWPWVRGYLELQVSRENMTGIFWGINDSMADRRLIQIDNFIVVSKVGESNS
ncbi:hypothetical protein FOL47_001627 [Perkinsus chesapeaki]|uniref:Calcineurin-like phosphoesterase domain-containing protein n=1 Tax=Perkinsus chesapeaki TaxID=330153 RepID=A0A7J6N0N7_PERCH|nr:hypothetical protein FOL47_001627 [Perkinsus chesapeaki]